MKVLMMCSIGALLMVVTYLIVQGMRCSIATRNKRKQLSDYNAKYIYLSYGTMSYVDEGSGEVILSVHGIFGGCDQAFDTCKDFVSEYRILAPSIEVLTSKLPLAYPRALMENAFTFLQAKYLNPRVVPEVICAILPGFSSPSRPSCVTFGLLLSPTYTLSFSVNILQTM